MGLRSCRRQRLVRRLVGAGAYGQRSRLARGLIQRRVVAGAEGGRQARSLLMALRRIKSRVEGAAARGALSYVRGGRKRGRDVGAARVAIDARRLRAVL